MKCLYLWLLIMVLALAGCGGGGDTSDGLQLQPDFVTLNSGETQKFTVTTSSISGVAPLNLIWSVAGGTYLLDDPGISYTAGNESGTYFITVSDDHSVATAIVIIN